MIWDDTGFLLSKNRYNENSLIVEIFTKDHGKISGIIFGGTSRKIKNYLQIGNNLHVNFNSKSENRIGYFKVEILKALTPYYFDDPKKLSCISSAIHLIKILTADSQKNKYIYFLLERFYSLLKNDNWIKNYIFWELKLLQHLGYHLELKSISKSEIFNNEKLYFVQTDSDKKYIPNFLIDVNDNEIDIVTLIKGLKLVGDYLDKTILKPNNINYPYSRVDFVNIIK